MSVCCVKNLRIGEGKPKVCLPIVGSDYDDILRQAHSFEQFEYDLVEFRVDFYKDLLHKNALLSLLKDLRRVIQKPILLTYRSKKEGGCVQLTDQQYIDLITNVCQSHCIDLVDIELMSGNTLVYQLIEIAHQNQVKVILSNHDFDKTPTDIDMRQVLEHMEIMGGDIYKMAVMPQTYKDVIRVLNVTLEMSHKLKQPIVTMAMGELGMITRMTGELTGSSMTFASAGKASAPGQMSVHDLQLILGAIHHD